MFVADARGDETTEFYADTLFPRLAAAHPFLKGYRDANVGTKPAGFTVAEGVPNRLVFSRGIPLIIESAIALKPQNLKTPNPQTLKPSTSASCRP